MKQFNQKLFLLVEDFNYLYSLTVGARAKPKTSAPASAIKKTVLGGSGSACTGSTVSYSTVYDLSYYVQSSKFYEAILFLVILWYSKIKVRV